MCYPITVKYDMHNKIILTDHGDVGFTHGRKKYD